VGRAPGIDLGAVPPGANDDGSGTVLCLELARVLRAVPTHATIRFALWGSEEQGPIGPATRSGNSRNPSGTGILAVYQNDMVATSWDPATRYWLQSFTGQANRATDEVAAAAVRLGYDPQVGIAAAMYHSPEDTIAKNVSLERLQVSLELIGCAAYATARSE
jgi:aminopeptidase YwaD